MSDFSPQRHRDREKIPIASGGEAVSHCASVPLCLCGEFPAPKNHGRGADKAKRLAMTDLPRRICAQCGARYQPVKIDQSFCCADHRKAFFNLRQRYGAQIFDLAILWRKRREKGAFANFTAQLDAILRDHKNELGHAISTGATGAGRMSKPRGKS